LSLGRGGRRRAQALGYGYKARLRGLELNRIVHLW
jgi:hypothetical protein